MSFAWEEYLTVAEALVQQRATLASEEACCRAAISRCVLCRLRGGPQSRPRQ